MKKNLMKKFAVVLVLSAILMPGCNLTSAQLTALSQSFAEISIDTIFTQIGATLGLSATGQSFLDWTQDVVQTSVDQHIDNIIPDDPCS